MESYAMEKIFENIKIFTDRELNTINKNRVLTTKLYSIYKVDNKVLNKI